jgi:magnesium and cobalt transporter
VTTAHDAWRAAGSLLLATYLAALKLALVGRSRGSIQQELEERGRRLGARWLDDHFDESVVVVSLVRMAARMAFFIFLLAEIVDLGAEVTLTWGDVAIAGVIALPIMWVCTSVLAGALARHVGGSLVTSSLPILHGLTVLFWPFTRVVPFIDEAVRRLSGANLRSNEHEAELLRSIEEHQREGGLDEEAATILENVVEFSSTDVGEVMTPRTDIEAIELTDDLAKIRAFILEVGHSRIPVYKGDVDHIVGILYVKDLMPYLGTEGARFQLEPLLRQPIIVPQTKPVSELLADFQRAEIHLAIIVDEYGGTAGMVTIEDVLEEIVGEIRDEHEPEDEEVPQLVHVDDTHAEVDGRFYIDDLNEKLGLALPEDADFDTVGGFVMAQLGRVPRAGDTFEAHNARFTAVKATPRSVQRIAIELLTEATANGQPRTPVETPEPDPAG